MSKSKEKTSTVTQGAKKEAPAAVTLSCAWGTFTGHVLYSPVAERCALVSKVQSVYAQHGKKNENNGVIVCWLASGNKRILSNKEECPVIAYDIDGMASLQFTPDIPAKKLSAPVVSPATQEQDKQDESSTEATSPEALREFAEKLAAGLPESE